MAVKKVSWDVGQKGSEIKAFAYIRSLETKLGRALAVQMIAKGASLNLEVEKKIEAIRKEVKSLVDLSQAAFQKLEGIRIEAESHSKACFEIGWSDRIKEEIQVRG